MPAKDKKKIDEIEPIQEAVDSSEELSEVINVRIPRKGEVKTESTDTDKTSLADENMTSTVSDVKSPDVTLGDAVSPSVDTNASKTVSSFSLLDVEDPKEEVSSEVKSAPEETTPQPVKDSTDTTADVKKWLEDVETEGDYSKEPKSKKKFVVGLFLLIFLMTILGGGFYYYQTNLEKSAETSVPTDSEVVSVPSSTPAPSEAPVNVADYSVQILNGTGRPGEAGNVETLLLDAGFETTATGNADSSSYEETVVQMKEDTPKGVYDIILETIGASYVVEMSETSLDEESEYDVLITLGGLEPELTPTPEEDITVTPTKKAQPTEGI